MFVKIDEASVPFLTTEQTKGFIASPDSKKIMADAGNVAWDMDRYDWLLEGEKFASTLVDFEVGFEIMPGTGGPAPEEDLNPYEVGPIDIHGE